MWRQSPFGLMSRCRWNHIPKWFVRRRSSKPTRAPLAKIVLRPSIERISKYQPRLPHRSRHHADIGKLLVSRFRSVSTSHGHDKANDFSTPFKAGFGKGAGNHVGKERVRGYNHIRSRHQNWDEQLRPLQEEQFKSAKVLRREYGEPGKRSTLNSIKRRGNAPYTALATSQLLLLLCGILKQSVRRVRDNSMNAIVPLLTQPIYAVSLKKCRSAERETPPIVEPRLSSLVGSHSCGRFYSVMTTGGTNKCRWCIQS